MFNKDFSKINYINCHNNNNEKIFLPSPLVRKRGQLNDTNSPINLFTFKNTAFTLAEVLITLGIIGVIAAMTLPTVIHKYKVKQYETGFKTAYSLLTQAVKNLNANDIIISQELRSGMDCARLIASSFKGAKNIKRIGVTNYMNYTNTTHFTNVLMDDGYFELPNGMNVFFEASANTNHPYIIIDTNGYKKSPNRYGFDTFAFIIGKNDIVYAGGDPNIILDGYLPVKYILDTKYCNSSSNSNYNGLSCAYKAFNKDYWQNLPK